MPGFLVLSLSSTVVAVGVGIAFMGAIFMLFRNKR